MKKWVCLFVCAWSWCAFGSAEDTGEGNFLTPEKARGRAAQATWFAPHLSQEEKEELFSLLQRRKSYVSPPYDVSGNPWCSGRHDGTLTPFTVSGLIHVRTVASACGHTPKVLDIGSGDGYHAGLFALAGAHVTMLEKDASLLEQKSSIFDRNSKNTLERTLEALLEGRLPEGTGVGEVARLIPKDALEVMASEDFQNAYDFVNAANVLDTMNPAQATQCVKGIYGCLKAGGVVHARVHTLKAARVKTGRSVFGLYCEEVEKGSAFPGWVSYRENDGFYGAGGASGFPMRGPQSGYTSLEADASASPMEVVEDKSQSTHGFFRIRRHSFFLFDVATLMRLFKGAGFQNAACYFEMEDGTLQGVQPGQETFVASGETGRALGETYGATHLCFVARKPSP
ncbi:MAG: hypothetical protein C0514_04520 [Candidatus Puniceispirillum sp.]|nr:hypothetical protein [Candidatus Puniceispirillum sp.]